MMSLNFLQNKVIQRFLNKNKKINKIYKNNKQIKKFNLIIIKLILNKNSKKIKN